MMKFKMNITLSRLSLQLNISREKTLENVSSVQFSPKHFLQNNIMYVCVKLILISIFGWGNLDTAQEIIRVRFSAGSVCCFLEQETFTPQKYW